MSFSEKPAFGPAVEELRLVISYVRHIHHSIVNSHKSQAGAILGKYHTQKPDVAS